MLDGELRQEWDLGKLLVSVPLSDSFGEVPREQRQKVFEEWKARAYKMRIELELPVVLPVVPLEKTQN